MPERNTMKKIQELQQVKGDAYDYYIAGNEDTDLFEKIFLVDDIVEEICKPDKYFLIGEKGSGKTAFFLQILRIKRLKQCTVIKLIVALESATAEYAVWSASNKSISTMPTCPDSIDFLHIIRTP